MVAALLTVWVRVVEATPKAAEIGWAPAERALVVRVAWPFESGTVPTVVAPSMKVTLPAGNAPEAVAVRVTGCLYEDAFAEDVRPRV